MSSLRRSITLSPACFARRSLSLITAGIVPEPGSGIDELEMKRPFIAVVNSKSDYIPGHMHLDKIAEQYIDKITTLCYYDLIKRKERSYAEIIPCNSI